MLTVDQRAPDHLHRFARLVEQNLLLLQGTVTGSYVPTTRQVLPGTGMSGGGALTADVTLTLANTAVVAGSYTTTSLTVDAQGRITAASSGTSADEGALWLGAGIFSL